jgi:glycosyltransferase involved in cell wall biosynthesis
VNVLILALDPALASSRLRALGLAPELRALGVEAEVEPYPRGFGARRRLARRMAGRDAVVVQKRLPSPLEARAWRAAGVPLVFDFDDALPFRQRPKRGSYDSPQRRRRFARALDSASAVAAGSASLAALVERPGKPLAILPTPVPLDVPRREHGRASGPLRIGWIGGSGNLRELDPLAPALRALAAARPLELVVISDAPWAAAGVPVRHVPWSERGQAAALAELDVGVMPLADNPWNRGKCAYKLLQYMAAGVPAVASPVGMNAELVRSGENGLLAADPGAWRAALEALAADPALRARLGAAGRATVAGGYSPAAVAARWKVFLERVLGVSAGVG